MIGGPLHLRPAKRNWSGLVSFVVALAVSFFFWWALIALAVSVL